MNDSSKQQNLYLLAIRNFPINEPAKLYDNLYDRRAAFIEYINLLIRHPLSHFNFKNNEQHQIRLHSATFYF